MKQIFYASLAALAFAACANDQGDAPTLSSTDALQISSAIATRAQGNMWNQGDEIGVFMFNYNSLTPTFAGTENTCYTTGADALSAVFEPAAGVTPLYYPQDGTVNILAYYPYSNKVQGVIYPIDVADQSDATKIDLMSAFKSRVVRNREAIDLEFYHRLSKVTVKLEAGEGLTPADLEGATVEFNEIMTSAEYNLDTDVISFEDGVPSALEINNSTMNVAGNMVASGILIPQTASFELTITLKDQEDSGKYQPLPFVDRKFEAGKEHIFTVEVRRTGIMLEGDITIHDWIDENEDPLVAE